MNSSTQELLTRGVAAAPPAPWLPVFSGGTPLAEAPVDAVPWFESILRWDFDDVVVGSWQWASACVEVRALGVAFSIDPFKVMAGNIGRANFPEPELQLELELELELVFPLPADVVGENCFGGTKDTAALVGVSIRPVLVWGMATLGGDSGEGGKKSTGYCMKQSIKLWIFIELGLGNRGNISYQGLWGRVRPRLTVVGGRWDGWTWVRPVDKRRWVKRGRRVVRMMRKVVRTRCGQKRSVRRWRWGSPAEGWVGGPKVGTQ